MKIAYADLVIAWCVVIIVATQAILAAENVLVVAALGVITISTLLRHQMSYRWQDLAVQSSDLTEKAIEVNAGLIKTLTETQAKLEAILDKVESSEPPNLKVIH